MIHVLVVRSSDCVTSRGFCQWEYHEALAVLLHVAEAAAQLSIKSQKHELWFCERGRRTAREKQRKQRHDPHATECIVSSVFPAANAGVWRLAKVRGDHGQDVKTLFRLPRVTRKCLVLLLFICLLGGKLVLAIHQTHRSSEYFEKDERVE